MKKRMAIMLIIAIIVFGGIVGFYFFKQAMIAKYMGKFAPPPVTVTTTTVQASDYTPYLSAIGSLQANQNIEVAPEIAGQVEKIYFTSGQYVEAGAPLLDLNSDMQQAQLRADQANLTLAQLNYQRSIALYKQKDLSRADLDTNLSKLQAAQAAVDGDQTALAKMHIVAPFAGKLGIREVSLGQYLAVGANIVALSSVDPILVQFSLPQQNFPQLAVGQAITLTVDTYPGVVFKGVIDATNADVAQGSRTILVEATVENHDRRLLPGMFVNVQVNLPTQKNVLFVPQTAIVYSLYGNSVYVVNKEDVAQQRFVTLGDAQGINMVVSKGLQAGETVVTSGQIKLHNGAKIVVNNTVKPD